LNGAFQYIKQTIYYQSFSRQIIELENVDLFLFLIENISLLRYLNQNKV